MTRSNSSRCPDGQRNPVAAAASALLGSAPVSNEPVARPFRAAGKSPLVDSCPIERRLVRRARDVVAAVDADVDRLERRGQACRHALLDADDDDVVDQDPRIGGVGRRSRRRGLRRRCGRAAVDERRIIEPQEVRVACPGGNRCDQARNDDHREQSQAFSHSILLVCPAETRTPRTTTFSSCSAFRQREIGSARADAQGREARTAAAGAAVRGLHEEGAG